MPGLESELKLQIYLETHTHTHKLQIKGWLKKCQVNGMAMSISVKIEFKA